MPKLLEQIDIVLLILEITIGRLVLDLPNEDLEKINEMIKRNLKNAQVQEEDHQTDEI